MVLNGFEQKRRFPDPGVMSLVLVLVLLLVLVLVPVLVVLVLVVVVVVLGRYIARDVVVDALSGYVVALSCCGLDRRLCSCLSSGTASK